MPKGKGGNDSEIIHMDTCMNPLTRVTQRQYHIPHNRTTTRRHSQQLMTLAKTVHTVVKEERKKQPCIAR